jgi:hypothetical protein
LKQQFRFASILRLTVGIGMLVVLPVTLHAAEDEHAASQLLDKVEVHMPREPAMMPYKDAYEMLHKFSESGKYNRLDLKVLVKSRNKTVKPEDIRLRLVGDTLDIPIDIAADGRVRVPLMPEALLDNAEIISNQPRKSLSAGIEFVCRLPAGERFSYRELMQMLPQADQAIREFVPWYIRWLVPAMSAVEFRFPKGVSATATVLLNDRSEQFHADEKGHVRVRLEKNWLTTDTEIVLSATPLEAVPTVWREIKSSRDDFPGG